MRTVSPVGHLRRLLVRRFADVPKDRGATMVVVALLIPVLLGVCAVAVDGGQLYVGRRQAQNGADASALALAQYCASNGLTGQACKESTASAIGALPGDNADLGTVATPDVCVQDSSNPCTIPASPRLPDCPYPLPSGLNGVQVHTRSELPLFFAPLWGETDKAVGACASAAWGPVGSMTATLPVTFSACEWTAATGGDPTDPDSGSYPSGPPYDASFERVIYLQNHGPDTGCETFNGHDAPGGFGWLEGDSGCGAVVTSGGWAHVDTGNNTPGDCSTLLNNLISSGKPVVYVPVYDCERPNNPGIPPDPAWDCAEGNGQQNWYHIAGFAQFYLTGWRLSGSNYNAPCSGGDRCLSGYFLKGLVPEGEIATDPTTPNFGLSVVQMAG